MNPTPRRRPMRFERRILLLALLAGAPGVVVGLLLLWLGGGEHNGQWTVTVLILVIWLGAAFAVRERAVRPLQTLANLLGALREGDFSIRARGARGDDALGLAYLEVNTLSETLRQQRLGAMEATALLKAVMEEIDVAVLAFDDSDRLRLANRAAERLLAQPAPRILGRTAVELGLGEYLAGPAPRTFRASFAGGSGSWELHRSAFRQGGLPHQLVVLTDLSRALREEERQAWQRLVRVLTHEINNSLTPISSIAGSLQDLLRQDPPPSDLPDDLHQGLSVIRSRSDALARFMTSYSRLARLPTPRRQPLEVETWIRRVAGLETRAPVRVHPGPPLTISADGDQLDQLLINLVRNAADAALETGGAVDIGWRLTDGQLVVQVDDEGPGLASTTNLFVPFFTTKPNGSGIGLALSRQIAEAHGGTLELQNRADGGGAAAQLRLKV